MIRIDGLIDAHVHLAMPDVPIGVPVTDLRSLGIVGAVEGGSYGALDYAAAAKQWRGQMPVFVYANVSPRGLRGPRGTWGPPADDPRAVFAATGTRPDGIKLRLGQHPERNDLDDARNARAVAAELGVRLMVHVTGATCDPDDLLALLRPGDVLTHCFCRPPFSLLDGAGKVRRRAFEARDRGVMFDLARGAKGGGCGNRPRVPTRFHFNRLGDSARRQPRPESHRNHARDAWPRYGLGSNHRGGDGYADALLWADANGPCRDQAK